VENGRQSGLYYAAFHAAREFFVGLHFVVARSDKAHAYLWLRLQNCKDVLLQQAGSELDGLRSERNKADYDFQTPLTQARSSLLVQTAERIILALADSVRLAAIQAEVIRYERDVLQNVTFTP
jgi:alkanesulfonate monooxygenase SsuD/methylene tetrahydromethanopterin reductase-like flavin-dependent oxidoreductase (luciferase family)